MNDSLEILWMTISLAGILLTFATTIGEASPMESNSRRKQTSGVGYHGNLTAESAAFE
jgi:hypothetical protein